MGRHQGRDDLDAEALTQREPRFRAHGSVLSKLLPPQIVGD
jgi:hypothetical protein